MYLKNLYKSMSGYVTFHYVNSNVNNTPFKKNNFSIVTTQTVYLNTPKILALELFTQSNDAYVFPFNSIASEIQFIALRSLILQSQDYGVRN